MQLTFSCSHCQNDIEADATLSGQQSVCPGCEKPVVVPEPAVKPGVTLGGFLLDRQVGSGGMGEVYLATQLSMERTVAVKVLPPGMSANKDAVQRFFHEARMAARLDHPNIVTVHDAGEDTGYCFYAMGYVDGRSLQDRLDAEGPLSEHEALSIVSTVAEALGFAWEKQHMLHRDIKPANIMIDRDGVVKVLDLGLAKSILDDQKMTMTGTILGTPNYMSPEQALAKENLDCRSDIYSLGATLFALLSGHAPYESESVYAVLSRLVTEDLPSVREGRPEISPACEALVQRMTAKEPAGRHADYTELIADIRRVLSGELPGHAAPTVTAPGGPGLRRKKRAAARGAAGMAPTQPTRSRWKAPVVIAGAVVGLLLILAILGGGDTPEQGAASEGGVTTQPPAGEDGAVATGSDGVDGPHVADGKDGLKPVEPIPRPSEPGSLSGNATGTDSGRPGGPQTGGARDGWESDHPPENQRQPRNPRAALFQLIMKVKDLADSGQLKAAIRELTDYDGPFKEETAERRNELLGQLQEAIRRGEPWVPGRWRDKDHDVGRLRPLDRINPFRPRRGDGVGPADGAVEPPVGTPAAPASAAPEHEPGQRIHELAMAVLRNDGRALALAVREAKAAPGAETKRAAGIVERWMQWPVWIADSFRPQVGNEIAVQFRSGTEQFIVEGVENERVVGKRVLRKGQSVMRFGHQFGALDLGPAERLRRIGERDAPEADLARALIALEVQREDKAREYFRKVGGALGKSLGKAAGELAETRGKRRVEQAVGALLQQAGIPEGSPEAALPALNERQFTPRAAAQLRADATALLRAHGDDPVVREHGQVLEALAMVGLAKVPDGCRPFRAEKVMLEGLAAGSADAAQDQDNAARRRGLPVEVVNALGMRFRLIPAGAFQRVGGGEVTITRDFYFGTFEVTQGQWQAVMGDNPSSKRGDSLPVVDVAWDSANQFCERLAKVARVGPGTYRLPTEAEWEYACRAGTRGETYYDPTRGHLSRFANYLDVSAPDRVGKVSLKLFKDYRHSDGFGLLAPGGSFPANGFGMHDMYGNVFEWCSDWKGPYSPKPGKDPVGPANGVLKIHRGGSYLYRPEHCNSVFRHQSPVRDYAGGNILFGNGLGLRVVMEIGNLETR